MSKSLQIDWKARVDEIGPDFAAQAAENDRDGRFVADNYAKLAKSGLISAAVPHELGGGGASHAEICQMLRHLAGYCGSTALALSMHQHLVAVTVWKYLREQPGEALLRRVASEQLVLVSTGAGDWLTSNGTLTRVPDGYRLTGTKRFASGSGVGDILVTSARYEDPESGPMVLHFPVPMSAAGVNIQNDWDTLGMRGTGSQTIELEDVFIPEASVSLIRPQSSWHPVWNVVLTVAAPIYSAPYLGIAEKAAEIARQILAKRYTSEQLSGGESGAVAYLVGEMENSLLTAQMAFEFAVGNAKNYDFAPDTLRATRTLQAKTLLTQAACATVDKAMEAVGGAAYFRGLGIERLYRDVRGAAFHPLPEKRQQYITGRVVLGHQPV